MKDVTSDDLRITNEEACHMIGLFNPERARQPYLVLQLTYLLVTAMQMARVDVSEKMIKSMLETLTGFLATRVINDLGPWKNVEYFDTNFLHGVPSDDVIQPSTFKSLLELVFEPLEKINKPLNKDQRHAVVWSISQYMTENILDIWSIYEVHQENEGNVDLGEPKLTDQQAKEILKLVWADDSKAGTSFEDIQFAIEKYHEGERA